jgi:hypothetical protein
LSFNKVRLGVNEIFEVIVKDSNGRKIEEWKCMKDDFPRVVQILFTKFGLSIIAKELKKNKDLDWAI